MSTQEIEEILAEHRELSAEAYHADPAIGSTQIEDFYRSRRLFHGRHVTKTIPGKEASPAMELGTLIHLRLLEPGEYTKQVAIAPADAPDRRSKKWWAEFEAEHRNCQYTIKYETSEQIEAIRESVLAKPHARRLIECEGDPEFSIFWQDELTGLPCKCRVDWFSEISLDLKTTADPSPAAYAKTLVNLGYARKLAHYRAGIETFCGEQRPFIHVAIGTEPPYSCGCYEIDDHDYASRPPQRLGDRQRRRLLNELADCYASDDWSDRFEHEILLLKLPAFAFTEENYVYDGH